MKNKVEFEITEDFGGEVALWIKELKGIKLKCNSCLATIIVNKFKGLLHPNGLKDKNGIRYLLGHECFCGAFYTHQHIRQGGY